jgi:hypothetical protein
MKLAILYLQREAQADALEESETFTTVVETGATQTRYWTTRQAALLVEFRRNGHLLELGTVTAESQRVATGLRRIRYQRVYVPDEAPSLEALEQAIEPRFLRFLWGRGLEGGLLPPATSTAVAAALAEIDPAFGRALGRLLREQPTTRASLSGDALQVAAQEADAVRLAADIANIPRPELKAAPPDGERGFIERLQALRVPESTAIAYDAMRFLDFDRIDDPSGVVVFTRGQEQLVVINVNTQPLEATKGADLIYVNERLGSVVLVQYKTMKKEGADADAEAIYRPDARLTGQLHRMSQIPILDSDGTPQQYRLHPGCAYIKLCSPVKTLTTEPTQLVSGMYIPTDYWEALASSPQVDGRRGGKVFSYRTVDRRVSNELFVALVRGAWIGTRGQASIDLTEEIRAALEGERSVTVATQRRVPPQ